MDDILSDTRGALPRAMNDSRKIIEDASNFPGYFSPEFIPPDDYWSRIKGLPIQLLAAGHGGSKIGVAGQAGVKIPKLGFEADIDGYSTEHGGRIDKVSAGINLTTFLSNFGQKYSLPMSVRGWSRPHAGQRALRADVGNVYLGYDKGIEQEPFQPQKNDERYHVGLRWLF
jgi:hypothetical protein